MQQFIIFPHQLFNNLAPLKGIDEVVLIEEHLFFKEYPFHKKKLAYHRASMQYYHDYLKSHKLSTSYLESISKDSDVRNFIKKSKASEIHVWELHDDWLEQRVRETCIQTNKKLIVHRSEYFLNAEEEIRHYFKGKKRFLQNDFYIDQRKKRNILIDNLGQPIGGQWNFDKDNRKKYPKGKVAPIIISEDTEEEINYKVEADDYVSRNFSNNPGELLETIPYPISHTSSKKWLERFIEERFKEFGPYEDAIVSKENTLQHSVLTPMLNIGLLIPQQIIDAVLKDESLTIESLEGFIRQIIGWREFIRAIYLLKGRTERTRNYWQFNRKIPSSFWKGSTGIHAIDTTIQKVLKTGYCHHIERLMLLGNFMLLCEFDPNEVYHWFMSLFIDAYDWVMVPNVYGMSQFADGGIMATKPYISGSNYVLKMSDYPKGDWCETWDALFWNFMKNHADFFSKNPRLSMLLSTYNKMSVERKSEIERISSAYFKRLETA